jgi:hypothetical protein
MEDDDMSRITRDLCAMMAPARSSPVGDLVSPFVWLKRHPIPVTAHFRHALVLTYALPRQLLEPLLPPGLSLDTFNELGFVAIAMVQTEALRPSFCPVSLGQDFFLSGYCLFTRYRTKAGRTLRGLRVLRTDTDHRLMAFCGNRLTHHNYRCARVEYRESGNEVEIKIQTPGAEADLHVVADLASRPAPLPAGSPFADLQEARLVSGPLPFAFDYEPETGSVVIIEGARKSWKPQPISVQVLKNAFFLQSPFACGAPILANAYHLENISCQWRRGIRERLRGGGT